MTTPPKKEKQIQISKELFLELCRYHLGGDNFRTIGREQRIQQGLQNKLDAVKRRSDYHRQKRDSHDKKNT